jgi:hypothetical protein
MSIGGGYGTKGRVQPGQSLIAFISGEYSLSSKWMLAFDSEWMYQKEATFKGKKGVDAFGDEALVGWPFLAQFSFAPEVEYKINNQSGLLAGLWFTFAGKNSSAFGSAFLAYLYIF